MKTIVFDFDGTLLNSSQRHVNVLKECMSELGYLSLDISDYLTFKADGNSTEDYLKKLGFCESDCQRISTWWIEKIESPVHLKIDYLYDDTIPTLGACCKKRYTLYLLSARQSEKNLINQVHNFRITPYFKQILCVSPIKAAKNKARIIMDLDADLIVGDTEADWEASIAAGKTCYILNRGFRNESYWSRLHVKSYSSLEPLINQL